MVLFDKSQHSIEMEILFQDVLAIWAAARWFV